jgi:hypothetical protein
MIYGILQPYWVIAPSIRTEDAPFVLNVYSKLQVDVY